MAKPVMTTKPAAHDTAARLADAGSIWGEAVPIIGTPGADYFGGRGIDLDPVPDAGGLRFHARCPWGEGGETAACALARYTDAITGEARGLWRRPITGKKPKALGPTSGRHRPVARR
jgi:hypothetical protein